MSVTQAVIIISIHAPAEGATEFVKAKEIRLYISIHAPAEGATHNPRAAGIGQNISIVSAE